MPFPVIPVVNSLAVLGASVSLAKRVVIKR